MEYITEPWQVIFLIGVAAVAAVAMVVWFRAGVASDAERGESDPYTLVRDGWAALLHWRPVVMSRATAAPVLNRATENAPDPLLSPVKRNGEMAGNGVAIGEMAGNDPFLFPDLFTGLARLVLAKEVGETDAIKIAAQATPGKGERYQEARRRLHAAMEREQPPAVQYRELTPDHKAALN